MSSINAKVQRIQEMSVRYKQADIDAALPLDSDDLEQFEKVIRKAASGGDIEADLFTTEGGIEIADILLAEVKRLRALVSPT